MIKEEELHLIARSFLKKPPRADALTGFKGVRFLKAYSPRHSDRYFAGATGPKGIRISLGGFATAKEAAKAYDAYVLEYYGDWVWTNFHKNGKPRKHEDRT